MYKSILNIRKNRKPVLIHAKVPFTKSSYIRSKNEWYRDDIEEAKRDPFVKLKNMIS